MIQPLQPVVWPTTADEAIEVQRRLAQEVIEVDLARANPVRTVAGADVAYDKESDRLFAAVVVLDAGSLSVVETATVVGVSTFPYVPGLFSFRELPALLECFEKLSGPVDLVICDGQGRAHPRRFGLACHLGVLLDIPVVGCAKQNLVGEHDPVDEARGSTSPVVDGGETVGMALRTQDGINPVFVSVGHRVSLESACRHVLACAPRYRLPETTREADQLANALRADEFRNFPDRA